MSNHRQAVVTIPLGGWAGLAGLSLVVDEEDAEVICGYSWWGARGVNTTYARTSLPRIEGKQSGMLAHRMIMRPPDGVDVDHLDGDGLNCRRSNLTIDWDSHNPINSRAHRDTTSRFKGVSWYRWLDKWCADIRVADKSIRLGYFDVEEDAARAYDKRHREVFAPPWCLNYPEIGERSAVTGEIRTTPIPDQESIS